MLTSNSELNDKDFELFRKLIFKHSGISLNTTKKNLVRSRLGKRLRTCGISTFRDYYKHVTCDSNGSREELVLMIDAIATNKTSFFREKNHFEFLKKTVIPELLEKKRGSDLRIRVWSAACSSGQEPYTLSMTLSDAIQNLNSFNVKILATDISTKVLKTASAGVYDKEDVEDIPIPLLKTYFQQGKRGMEEYFTVKKSLREMVAFRRLNLMIPQYPFKGLFDFIFCRNVMIYFEKATQEDLIGKFYRYLQSGGYLFLGHAESLAGVKSRFSYIQPSVYRKV